MSFQPPPLMLQRIQACRPYATAAEVAVPALEPSTGDDKLFLGIESFARHMSNEGWQQQNGLEAAGYQLWGHKLTHHGVDVNQILQQTHPKTVILQDKREWDPKNPACIAKTERFQNYEVLGNRKDIFKLTVLKDCQHNVVDSAHLAGELGIHAWIVYYHEAMVKHLAPYVRLPHLIRTYHSLDPNQVPPFVADRGKHCLLSGAADPGVYPLRHQLFKTPGLRYITKLVHPGYHASGSNTPEFLQTLSEFKVAICTCSVFGYALRKIIEATACGCKVITDLPPDEILPGIDENLVRISPQTPVREIDKLAGELSDSWDQGKQRELAYRTINYYNYHRLTRQLALDIEQLRERLLQSRTCAA